MVIDTEGNTTEEIMWKHLSLDKKLSPDKNNIFIFCDEIDYLPAQQLLENPDNNLFFESSEGAMLSVVRHANVHGLVLYDTPITEKLIQLLNSIKNKDHQIVLPVIYISEEIDYFLQEQIIELGVDTFIQLPTSKSFIQKKLLKLIDVRKDYLNDKSTQQLFKISSDNDKMLSPNEKLIKKALAIINENIHNPTFNIERLTEMLFVSKIKCYRAFKDVLKQSPSDFIIKLRLQKAEYLLKNNSLNISEISMECGFNDPKYFSRLFKKNFECSPKEFRTRVGNV
nr:AraC family transcriptional regulator [Zobellia laminariae]